MMRPDAWMLREIAEIPPVIARQMVENGVSHAETGALLRNNPPQSFARPVSAAPGTARPNSPAISVNV